MGYTQDGTPKNIHIWELDKTGNTAAGGVSITVSKDFTANQLVFPFAEYWKKRNSKKNFTVVPDYMKEKQNHSNYLVILRRQSCDFSHYYLFSTG